MYSSSQSTHCTVVMIASLEWEGMQYYSEFLRILQEDSGILQASTESLTPSILLGFRWSVKYIFAPNSPIFRRSPRKKEDGENHKMQSISLFKQKQKIVLLHSPVVITYYIKPFHKGADKHKLILMSLLRLAAETKMSFISPEKFSLFSRYLIFCDDFMIT